MSSHTAPPMRTATHNHTDATVTALRTLAIRRRPWRTSGRAMPFSMSRSVGNTSGLTPTSGTMVVAMCAILPISVK